MVGAEPRSTFWFLNPQIVTEYVHSCNSVKTVYKTSDLKHADCCDGSDEYLKRVDCANTCGGAIKESSERLEEDLGQSTTFDSDDVSEAIPDKEQKKFGEDLVSKLKGRLCPSS